MSFGKACWPVSSPVLAEEPETHDAHEPLEALSIVARTNAGGKVLREVLPMLDAWLELAINARGSLIWERVAHAVNGTSGETLESAVQRMTVLEAELEVFRAQLESALMGPAGGRAAS